jgi:hypothetical protein
MGQSSTLERARVAAALDSMARMLSVDGYDLDVDVDEASIALTVRATPEACAECLVPKSSFAMMASRLLADAGIDASPEALLVAYPADAATSVVDDR